MIPAGVLVTVPRPVPDLLTFRATATMVNEAVTLCAAVMLTTQLPVPVHAPLQPEKVLPVVGVAVSVTLAPIV